MKNYVVQTVAIYALALLVCCFINIDKIAPWYRLEIAASDSSPVLQGLEATERLSRESGVKAAVKKFDCSTAFLFNQTYKDNSDCFLEDDLSSENRCRDLTKAQKLRVMARVLYDHFREQQNRPAGMRIAPADWTAGPAPLRLASAVEPAAQGSPASAPVAVPAPAPLQEERGPAYPAGQGGLGPANAVPAKTAPPSTSQANIHPAKIGPSAISPAGGPQPVERPPATPGSPVEQANVEVEMGASKQLLHQKAVKTPLSIVPPVAPELHEHDLTPTSILVVGDSLAIALARSFERALERYDDVKFARVGKVSSGLAIPHLFDWEKKIQVLIEKYQPDLIVILMGINDANNNIRVDGQKAVLGTASWPVAYQTRVERFLDIIKARHVPVYWVGLPIVRDEAMTARICLTNETAKKACSSASDCRFIDTWELLTDENGGYTNYKKDNKGYNVRIRAKDGIHFSREGGDLLTNFILEYITKYVELHPKKTS